MHTQNASDHGGNVWAAARSLGCDITEISDFSASVNPLGTPAWVRAAIRRAGDGVAHYPDPDNHELVAAAAGLHNLQPRHIIFGNGAAELIDLLVSALKPPAALVSAPTFSLYERTLGHFGVTAAHLRAWPDPPAAAALHLWAAAAPPGSIIFLCNPNNPTGRLLPAELSAAALALEHVYVAVDESFLDFAAGAPSLARLTLNHPRLIVLRSLTKMYAIPGLRLGWAAGPPGLIARMRALQTPWSVNSVAAAAGVAALSGRDYAKPTAAAVAELRQAALAALNPFRPLLAPLDSHCNFLLVRLAGITGSALQKSLFRHRILIRTCTNFHGLDDHYIRLAVRPLDELARLTAALTEIIPPGTGR